VPARREVTAVSDFMTIGAATSPVVGFGWTGEAAGARRTVPPVNTVKGTGLPVVGCGALVGVVAVGMGADQVQGIGVDRVRTAAAPGIPPRWRPVRC
jgi:hypothetical protein